MRGGGVNCWYKGQGALLDIHCIRSRSGGIGNRVPIVAGDPVIKAEHSEENQTARLGVCIGGKSAREGFWQNGEKV